MIALRLAKSGYCSGDPEKVMEMRADFVMAALSYENFTSNYEKKYLELNRPQ